MASAAAAAHQSSDRGAENNRQFCFAAMHSAKQQLTRG